MFEVGDFVEYMLLKGLIWRIKEKTHEGDRDHSYVLEPWYRPEAWITSYAGCLQDILDGRYVREYMLKLANEMRVIALAADPNETRVTF